MNQIPDRLKGNWNLKSSPDSESALVVGEDTIQVKCQKKTEDWQFQIEFSMPENLIGPFTEAVKVKSSMRSIAGPRERET